MPHTSKNIPASMFNWPHCHLSIINFHAPGGFRTILFCHAGSKNSIFHFEEVNIKCFPIVFNKHIGPAFRPIGGDAVMNVHVDSKYGFNDYKKVRSNFYVDFSLCAFGTEPLSQFCLLTSEQSSTSIHGVVQ